MDMGRVCHRGFSPEQTSCSGWDSWSSVEGSSARTLLCPERTPSSPGLQGGRAPTVIEVSITGSVRSEAVAYGKMTEWLNGTVSTERLWSGAEKWLLVAVLGLEVVVGVAGNSLVLLVKAKCRAHFRCRYWLPLLSLTMSDLGCSLLIISSSLVAIATGGQMSPWCEVVSLLKFAFITSSIGSIAVLCVQRFIGRASTERPLFVVMAIACSASWGTGLVFGSVPVIYTWIRFDPAEMLCAVFWESSYSDMLLYILCAFSLCVFLPFLLILVCSLLSSNGCRLNDNRDGGDDEADLSAVAPVLVASYMICYSPFAVAELILLGRLDLSQAPSWLRTLSSVMSYLDCAVNPLIYCSHRGFREAGLALLWTGRKPPSEPALTAVTTRAGEPAMTPSGIPLASV